LKLDDRQEQAAVTAAAKAAHVERKPSTDVGMPRPRLRLGDMLVAQNVLTAAQLTAALSEQRRSGRRLGRILIEDGIASEATIGRALALQMKVPFVDVARESIDPKVAQRIPAAAAQRLRALPLDEKSGVVRVAMADPTDFQAFDEVQRLIGREIDLVVITESQLGALLERLSNRGDAIRGLAREVGEQVGGPVVDTAELAAQAAPDEAPVARLLQNLFEEAMLARASDIHVEPQEANLVVRMRIDGVLVPHIQADARIAPAVVQRLKLVAGLDIAERRLPQDGRFVARVKDKNIDIRISTMPTQHGEGTVLRLLPSHNGLLDLERLGMPARVLARVRAFAEEPHGMALVTGPTGSGKTTTLYGLLASLNTSERKIITVEDPVEYRLPGAMQVQVNEKINLTFGTVLRSTLRQDPDVVLVGEMRDQDTVETGLRAAMTGHLVLSTLHTNDAASTPLRLLDMNAPLFLVASSLRVVLAQRLVRTVCKHCAQPHRATPQEHAFLHTHLRTAADVALTGDSPLRKGKGCAHCHGSGYRGRHGVYELLEMTPEVVQPLAAGDTTAYLANARRAVGDNSLAHHACELAFAGVTTVPEAIRTVGRGHDAT